MSGIRPATDRPIPTNEKTVKSQQTSETESIQNMDVSGKAPLDAPQVIKEQMRATETKDQQFESRLGGLARETELQSQLPVPSVPVLNKFPDVNSHLDRNIHLDEKIDVTKNLPGGHTINTGLTGLEWGIGKEKTGPNHMGVDMTTGGMKAPKDVLADVLNPGKASEPKATAPQQGSGDGVKYSADSGGGRRGSNFTSKEGNAKFTPPPGVQLNSRAPNSNLLSQPKDPSPPLKPYEPPPPPPDTSAASDVGKFIYDNTMGRLTGKKWDDSMGTKPKSMTDPDAPGTGDGPTAQEVEKIVKLRLGQVEHHINPDLGVGNSAPSSPEARKDRYDLVRDPKEDGDSTVGIRSPEQVKAAVDIHGPRTVHPDAGINPQPTGGVKGGGDPSNPS
jgi:hypothetical protein